MICEYLPELRSCQPNLHDAIVERHHLEDTAGRPYSTPGYIGAKTAAGIVQRDVGAWHGGKQGIGEEIA